MKGLFGGDTGCRTGPLLAQPSGHFLVEQSGEGVGLPLTGCGGNRLTAAPFKGLLETLYGDDGQGDDGEEDDRGRLERLILVPAAVAGNEVHDNHRQVDRGNHQHHGTGRMPIPTFFVSRAVADRRNPSSSW